ncbi:UNC93-like protein [Ischnura elegans]|uniref:UNC93-like protein n=1 Tax=Ischnura elegans TaxID=197161 RepID=UPI001ED89674|nr:UNC93-like protein [Ischnura elegans]
MKGSKEGSTHHVDVESSGIDNLAFLEQLAASHTIDLDQPLDSGQFYAQANQGDQRGTTNEPNPNTPCRPSSVDAGKKVHSGDTPRKDLQANSDALKNGRATKRVESNGATVSGTPGNKRSDEEDKTVTVKMDDGTNFGGEKKFSSSMLSWFTNDLKERWDIGKNIIVISFAFMFHFTAFQGTANLQSSINAADGLGTMSLVAVFGAVVLSCTVVPTLIIRRFTVKWTLTFSLLCYVPYIMAQFYPRTYTLLPTALIAGFGAAPMWASKATYITQVGVVYAKMTNQISGAIVVRFFGFFFFAWQTAELWGNLISSMVFTSGIHGSVSLRSFNDTVSADYPLGCGANFCSSSADGTNDNLERPPDSEIYTISAIYLLFVALAVLIIAIFLDPLSKYGEKTRGKDPIGEKTVCQLMAATFIQLRNPYQILLIPLTVWSGMEQAFIGADFTQAFVSCALGIPKVGYVMMCYGIVDALCSVLFGLAMKYVGCPVIVGAGIVLHSFLLVALNIWRPAAEMGMAYFVFSGLWGVGDAVWQTQLSGIYGDLFKKNKEAAFSNLRMWESLGFVISYSLSGHMCIRMKLFVLLTVLAIGAVGYVAVEILHRRRLWRRAARKAKEAADPTGSAIESGHPKAGRKAAEAEDASLPEWENDDLDDDVVIARL